MLHKQCTSQILTYFGMTWARLLFHIVLPIVFILVMSAFLVGSCVCPDAGLYTSLREIVAVSPYGKVVLGINSTSP